MTARFIVRLLLAALILVPLAACGKRSAPRPPADATYPLQYPRDLQTEEFERSRGSRDAVNAERARRGLPPLDSSQDPSKDRLSYPSEVEVLPDPGLGVPGGLFPGHDKR